MCWRFLSLMMVLSSVAGAQVALLPGDVAYVLPDDTNTAATAGAPNPFWSAASTTDSLWRRRTSLGLDALGNTWIYEKDLSSSGDPVGVGDAAPLTTRISGLTPGKKYSVMVAFISVPSESWRIRGGLAADELTEFRPGIPAGRVIDLGREGTSNRNQYLGHLGDAVADSGGKIDVFIDDGEGTGGTSRTWYAGVAYSSPFSPVASPTLPTGAVEIAPDGAWTWFNDERAIMHGGFVYTGYVRADGHVGLTRFDPASGQSSHVQLSTSASQELDDHNNPSLTVLPDGRLLAVYARHNTKSEFYYRRSSNATPSTIADWGAEQVKVMPTGTTYANTYRLSGENDRIFNFTRSINFNPTLLFSEDNGETWGNPVHFISNGSGSTRPYVRYVSNRKDRIDLIYTDGHPRNFHNSIYHMGYRDGVFRKSDGTALKALADLPILHNAGERGSVIYQYSDAEWGPGDGPDQWIPHARGWIWDIHYGKDGNPVCAFQVQPQSPGVYSNSAVSWPNHRIHYYYARWTGTEWQKRFIAQAGRGLYASEPDYGGGMAIDPEDPRVVYISSNAADPTDISTVDAAAIPLNAGSRYEIWRGFTADGGLTFSWTQVTRDSAEDNLRPIVPEGHKRQRALLWFYGSYKTYKNFQCRVVGLFGAPTVSYSDWAGERQLAADSWGEDSDRDGISNLAEYLAGSDPGGGDFHASVPRPGEFLFKAARDRSDAEWRVECSEDLSAWRTVAVVRRADLPNRVDEGFSLDPLGNDDHILRMTTAVPDRAFYRLLPQPLW